MSVGDLGRIDLYGPKEAPRLAGALYDSIFNKIVPLGDGVILCPAHGAGSICGGNISKRDESTLGIERAHNPVLQLTNRNEFVAYKVREQYNLEGAPLLGRLPYPPPLRPPEFKNELESGAVVLDTRTPPAFGGAHIKGSYGIWLGGIPTYAGWVLSYETPLLLVLESSNDLEHAVRYLVRLGYDNLTGYLSGGIASWYNSGFTVEPVGLATVQELEQRLDSPEDMLVFDVRDENEWKSGI